MPRTSRKLPTEWTKYSPIGEVIPHTRLFAFKTPLSTELQQSARRVAKDQRFTPVDLFWKIAEKGKQLGLAINVSNTQRYYHRGDIEGMMVGYKAILSPGKRFLERKDVVKSFIRAVDEFLADNSDNDRLIGVHCSNGVNRAGYLICRYLVDRLGWSSHQAIDAFETARGYAFERGSYVQAIHNADRERRLKARQQNTAKATPRTPMTAGSAAGSGSSEPIPYAIDGEPSEYNHYEAGLPAGLVIDRNEVEFEPIGGEEKAGKRKKRKRRKQEGENDIEREEGDSQLGTGFDPALAAQMMQQFFALERQMKETAAKVAQHAPNHPFPDVLPPVVPPPLALGPAAAAMAQRIGNAVKSSTSPQYAYGVALSASSYSAEVEASPLPLAYSTPNPLPQQRPMGDLAFGSVGPSSSSTPPVGSKGRAIGQGSAAGPFPGLSLKTQTLAKTANFAFTTQKLKESPLAAPPLTSAPTAAKQQRPAYTPKQGAGSRADPLQAAKAAAQSVSIAMELRGAEQISDDEEGTDLQQPGNGNDLVGSFAMEGSDWPGEVGMDDESQKREIDFDSMGKVDVKEHSASHQRRVRRKKLEKQFEVMRRGKFWEINQMKKESGK